MRKINLIVFVFFLLNTAIAQNEKADAVGPNDRWVDFFNSKIDQIDSLYLPKAILFSASGEIFNSEQERKRFYQNLKATIVKVQSIATINRAEITPDVSYEIGAFENSKKIKFKHLIIWKKVNGVFLREAEMISKSENETQDVAGITAARQQWMGWCNGHKVKELVTNSYLENAIYYNNGHVTLGTENIEKEYRYMSNPKYQLTLTPIIVETVSENLVYEIGQCSGSYGGTYVLVWIKRNGIWKVLFDSN